MRYLDLSVKVTAILFLSVANSQAAIIEVTEQKGSAANPYTVSNSFASETNQIISSSGQISAYFHGRYFNENFRIHINKTLIAFLSIAGECFTHFGKKVQLHRFGISRRQQNRAVAPNHSFCSDCIG